MRNANSSNPMMMNGRPAINSWRKIAPMADETPIVVWMWGFESVLI